MTFEEALTTLSDDERQQIDEKLRNLAQHTGLCLQAVSNIRNEGRLPMEAWRALVEALRTAEKNPNAIQEATTTCFRRWILCGPELPLPRPSVFGHAATVDKFCRHLVRLGYFLSLDQARAALDNLLFQPPEIVTERWRRYQLGRYLMWSPFNPEMSTEDPFDGMPTADGIRGLLGLDRNERGQPLLLLEYTLPGGTALRFPTVADAYAGDRWSYFFRPAPDGATYGMTMPWPEHENEPPRPEAVHEVIRGEYLCAPLRKVS